MLTKQSLLGLALMLGGAVMVVAMVKGQPQQTNIQNTQPISVLDDVAHPTVQPLTADIETETRILEQKQQERERRVAALEKETQALLAAQEKARSEAMQKAAEDAQNYAKANAPTTPTVETRPEAVALAKEQERQAAQRAAEQKAQRAQEEAQKTAQAQKTQNNQKTNNDSTAQATQKSSSTHTVQAGDNLIKLSQQYGVPVSIIAEANNMSRNDALQRGRTLKIPSKSEIRALERKAAEREAKEAAERAAKQRAEQADARLRQARQEARDKGVNGNFGVQVALAANKENADALVNSLRSAGYKVSTSQTNRGVRVVVGPERSKEAADALRQKMLNDSRIKANGAWVTQMQ